ncbi:hypothetical protein E1202_04295 [Saccharopolyspora karakumensis]|uniref:Uncharacterized protein n=1 Tax=Saccharopolyspora karakumensis TaxID=2530386 RepID=A0A4R5C0E1_9PSEU|nr:hypothetical protein [Saccharopolyspora karakumensis]TDD91959.1 hypothetical protein E1202_04295 [Saccharopolyspora karakumensis]
MNGLVSWLLSGRRVPRFSTSDGSRGARRRRELTCGEHKPSRGEQVSEVSVRWTCDCGAYRFEIDAPAPHVDEVPTAAYLEMERRGLQGKKGPWRSQITGKPLPVERTEPAAEPLVEASASERAERELRCDRKAREYCKRYGPNAARDEAYWALHDNDAWMAEALFRAADRVDGGETTWPF